MTDQEQLCGWPILARMRELDVPGVSVAVIEGGRIVDTFTFGVRELQGASRVVDTTRFQACSISKPVSCLAMLRLVQRGDLDLDRNVNDYLRSWHVPPNGHWRPRITLRHLASHSAGLTTHGFPGYRRGESLPTLVEILSGAAPANTQGVRVDIVPGVQFRYSGGGTTVLQLVLEEVTGVAFADLVRDLVLDPLGMEFSGYEQPLPAASHDQAAVAHRSDGSPVEGGWHVYPELAAAALWTTPTDLARYAIGLQQAAAGHPDALISPELADAMLTPQTSLAPGADRIGSLNSVGLGPFVRSEGGRTTYFGHSGGNEGFRCHLIAHKDAAYGAVVMTNSDNGGRIISDALEAIAASYGWEGYAAEPLQPIPPRGADLDRFVGSYALTGGPPVDISRVGDRLDVTIGDQTPIPFVAVSDTELASQLVDSTLKSSDDGLLLRQSEAELPCTRVDR